MDSELLNRLVVLEDKKAIEELTNSYLVAADRKDPASMASHFTIDGKLESVMADGTIILEGSKGISEGFTKILSPISTAYHLAGQLQITLNNNTAKGISYTLVMLVGTQNEERYVRKIWAVYNDDYEKHGTKWLIKKRTATVAWEEKQQL